MVKRPLAAAKDPHAAARPRGKDGPASGSPRRSHCSPHEKGYVLVFFLFPLLQGLVYWKNEDPISV